MNDTVWVAQEHQYLGANRLLGTYHSEASAKARCERAAREAYQLNRQRWLTGRIQVLDSESVFVTWTVQESEVEK